jgi:hypothetical protein
MQRGGKGKKAHDNMENWAPMKLNSQRIRTDADADKVAREQVYMPRDTA